jgi:NAD(P)H-quinone oxidoreductase subunit 5
VFSEANLSHHRISGQRIVMNQAILDSNSSAGLLLLAIPFLYGVAALLPVRWQGDWVHHLWQRAARAAAIACGLAFVSSVVLAWQGPQVSRLPVQIPFPGFEPLHLGVRLDVLTVVMLGLVSFIGLVILHYSRRYLGGDPGQAHYVRFYMATLASVSLLVMANHLALIWLTWFGTSLARLPVGWLHSGGAGLSKRRT